MRKFALAALLASAAALLAGITPVHADDAILTTTLSGAAEVPGPGDPDASGSAVVFIDDDSNSLCLFLRWRNVDGTPSGLHIHRAPVGVAGPVLVGFATPAPGRTSTFQCVHVEDEEILDAIAANPQQHYLNLHTPVFPPGAIRGQLQAA